MKLIIKEYLSLLKESEELDKLLPQLFLEMSLNTISTPQKGVRQDGVDIAAVGKHPETDIKSMFLFVVKSGDVGRNDWDSGPQSIRQSLNEVKDVYLNGNIATEHKDLPVVIILCTGGELKQEVQKNWTSYESTNEIKGRLSYELWDGDKLTGFVENHLFNEHLLPDRLRSKFRKTLALLSDPDYGFSDYFEILKELLIKKGYGDIKKSTTQKKITKALRTVHLCQQIILHWSKNENNLKPAIICTERTALNSWDLVRRLGATENKSILLAYLRINNSLLEVHSLYASKIQKHCKVKNGLSGYSQDYLLNSISLFENIGYLSICGLLFRSQAFLEQDNVTSGNELIQASQTIVEMLKSVIQNNKGSFAPTFDNHIIDISAAFLLLKLFNEEQFINWWIVRITDNISFSYTNMGKYFPISSGTIDDLIDFNYAKTTPKEKAFKASTLIPILMQWCLCTNFEEGYALLQNFAKEAPDCTMQIWYPDSQTDEYIYTTQASNKSGNSDAPMDLSISNNEMKRRINLVQKKTIQLEDLSACKVGLLYFPIVASRHFRTPILPVYWQSFLFKDQ